MNETQPIIMFHASVRSTAPADAIYAVLADPRTALEWGGREAPKKSFRLLTMDAGGGPLAVGDTFSSTGANITGTFHDRSAVVEAEPGARFGFDTESTLTRKHAPTWHVQFAHRYTLAPTADGTEIAYRCEVRPQNYVPWWLRPGMRTMTRRQVPRLMRKHLANLAAMARADAPSGPVR
jgi:Polyketide cyclase / dehydrase and lipid transport